MNERRLKRLTFLLSALAVVIVWAVFIPMKLQGALPAHFTWFKLLIGPPIGFTILPAVMLIGLRRSAAR